MGKLSHKLGEHSGSALFAVPEGDDPRWSPSRFTAPELALPGGVETIDSHSPLDSSAEEAAAQSHLEFTQPRTVY